MLKEISIKNYALIEELLISFREGLTTITGETGAGKSIILGALSLVLGKRADSSVLTDPSGKCVVEAIFHLVDRESIQTFFKEHDLDIEQDILMRREINKEGKSRAFINDTPVKLSLLKELGSILIDIHSQPDNRAIADPQFQIKALDSFASNGKLLQSYTHCYLEFVQLEAELQQLKETQQRSREELDYMTFQHSELSEAELTVDEQEKLEAELKILEKAGGIIESVTVAVQDLSAEETGSISSLRKAFLSLHSYSDVHEKLAELASRLQSSEIEIMDINAELEALLEEVESNPSRLTEVEERLSQLYRLQKKHGVESVAQLIALRDKLSEDLMGIDSLDENIQKAETQLQVSKSALLEAGQKLSQSRIKKALDLEKQVKEVLSSLGMKNATLKIEVTCDSKNFRKTGIDEIRWLFTANMGLALQELQKVASGGELARLMLAIKTVLSKVMSFPTLIFDEIDTGVSGEIALRVGKQMKQISQDTQVISITHLPQIAARGDQQLMVYKIDSKKKTSTMVRELDKEERIREIAKMLSGSEPSPAAIENAKDLLQPA